MVGKSKHAFALDVETFTRAYVSSMCAHFENLCVLAVWKIIEHSITCRLKSAMWTYDPVYVICDIYDDFYLVTERCMYS